jgi:sigma-B regulation protein RsbU (phosphoserine phosphatase)
MLPNVKFKVKQVQLDPDDIVIGYTDGVTEAHAPDGKLFSNDRLLELLNHPTSSASELVERIRGALLTYMKGAPQFDDITMLSVRRLV